MEVKAWGPASATHTASGDHGLFPDGRSPRGTQLRATTRQHPCTWFLQKEAGIGAEDRTRPGACAVGRSPASRVLPSPVFTAKPPDRSSNGMFTLKSLISQNKAGFLLPCNEPRREDVPQRPVSSTDKSPLSTCPAHHARKGYLGITFFHLNDEPKFNNLLLIQTMKALFGCARLGLKYIS